MAVEIFNKLNQMPEKELASTIRVAENILKTKVAKRHDWTTGNIGEIDWDVFALLSPQRKARPLSLSAMDEEIDWNVFKLLSPVSKSKVQAKLVEAEIDWSVFNLLSPMSKSKIKSKLAEADIDWDVFAMLNPSRKSRPFSFCEKEEKIDWSVFNLLSPMSKSKANIKMAEAEIDWSIFNLLSPKSKSKVDAKVAEAKIDWDVFAMLGPKVKKINPLSLCAEEACEKEIDWNIFKLLSPTTRTRVKAQLADHDIDWNVFSLLSPKTNAKVLKMFISGEVNFDEFEADWSGDRVPLFHRGFRGSRRHRRRPIQRRTHGKKAATEEPPKANKYATALQSKPIPRIPASARRLAPPHRIQQPAGGCH